MAEAESSRDDIRVECSETSPVTRSLSVEIAAARVSRAFDRAYADLRKHARVKGFRPGKVPRSVLEKMYGDSIPDEIERMLVSESLADAIELADVKPASEPDIETERPRQGSAFKYTALVEVKPEIELPKLEGLPGRKPRVEIGEEEVEQEISRLRERNAPLVEEPEDAVAAEGHTLTLDFVGRVDGEVFEGGSGQGVDVEIGAGRLVPGFEEQLVGARSGEDREVRITFPEDYPEASLRGKSAEFACHVVSVRKRQLPELDDEFAKDLGEFESLEDLRARIRADLAKGRESEAENILHRSLMDSLLERCSFEVPPGVVERQLQSQLESTHRQFQGRVPHDVLHQQLTRMQETGRPLAERRVREAFLLEALATRHGLEVSEVEVEARLGEMAEAQGMDAGTLREMASRQGWLPAIEVELRNRKVFELLASHALIDESPIESSADEA